MNLKKAIELKNSIQTVLKRFENLNIIDMETARKAELRNEANEKIKLIGRNFNDGGVCRLNNDDDEVKVVVDQNQPCTSSKFIEIELSEKERKKQEMLKVKKKTTRVF